MARTSIATSAFTGTNGTEPTGFTALNPLDGALTIDTNRIESTVSFGPSSTDANDSRWTGAGTFTAAQYAKVTVTGMSPGGLNKMGVILRASGDTETSRDLYRVYVLDDNTPAIVIQKILNGTPTQLSSVNGFTDGQTVEGEIEEIAGTTTIRSYRNGTLVATVTDTSSPITATGAPGVCGGVGFGPGMFGDNAEFGNLSAASGTPLLRTGGNMSGGMRGMSGGMR